LVGHAGLNRTTGVNQGWNHAGNIVSAVVAMLLVMRFSLSSVFFTVAAVSLVAAASVFLIRPEDLHESHVAGHARRGVDGLGRVLRDRRAVVLLSATAIFHLANAPVMPLVALYIMQLHGTHTQVAAVVLVAQAVMIPVALLAGRLCDTWGRRPTFLI